MGKYYILKRDVNNDPELLESINAKSLKAAMKLSSEKYIDYIISGKTHIIVVSKKGYELYWKEAIKND